MKYDPITRTAMLLVSLLGSPFAQGVDADQNVNKHFSIIALDDASELELYYQPEPDAYAPLILWKWSRSPQYSIFNPSEIVLYRSSRRADGSLVYHPVVRTRIPPSMTTPLLLLHKGDGKTDSLSHPKLAPVVDDSLSAFPLQTLRFYNATSRPLLGQLDDLRLELPPGWSQSINLEPYLRREVSARFALLRVGRYHQVFRGKWSFYPHYREIMLILPSAGPNDDRIRIIRLPQHKEEIYPNARELHPSIASG